MDKFFGNRWMNLWDEEFTETIPSVNVTQEKDQIKIEMAAPGLKKDDFNVEVEGNNLTISCESERDNKTNENENDESKYSHKEYSYSRFSRTMTLPQNADLKKISAKYTDGILRLTIPTKENESSKNGTKITIE